jgi:hypothetical protein
LPSSRSPAFSGMLNSALKSLSFLGSSANHFLTKVKICLSVKSASSYRYILEYVLRGSSSACDQALCYRILAAEITNFRDQCIALLSFLSNLVQSIEHYDGDAFFQVYAR